MKKIALTIALCLPMALFAQKKTTPKAVTKPTAETLIKLQAEKWFKNVYVESNFKDPYSYKFLKSEIIPVTVLAAYQDSIQAKNNKILLSDTTGKLFDVYKKMYLSSLTSLKKEKESTRSSGNMLEYYTKRVTTDSIKVYKMIDDFKDATQSKISFGNKIATLPELEKNKVFCYKIYIDCHANNSYGGQVLGKYFFNFKNGSLLPFSSVLKLND